jgi:hypothetical protein
VAEAERAEKITINLGIVDLGQIDLLIREGFSTNRTGFIGTAIHNQLSGGPQETLVLRGEHCSRSALQELRAAGHSMHILGLGLAGIAGDVTPELATTRRSPRSTCSAPTEPVQPSTRRWPRRRREPQHSP